MGLEPTTFCRGGYAYRLMTVHNGDLFIASMRAAEEFPRRRVGPASSDAADLVTLRDAG
jgi:hypothetical protein